MRAVASCAPAPALSLAVGGRRFGRRAAIVVAHPDDETLGAATQFGRWERLVVVHVTDGAPRSLVDARRAGFDTAPAYAAARRGELQAALRLAGHPPRDRLSLGIPDQQAPFAVVPVARRLERMLAGVDVVFTHAFEGGHPDHDATCIAVHAAVERLAAQGRGAPAVLEMPLYRDDGDGRFLQGFAEARPALTRRVAVRAAALDRKVRMIRCFATQAPSLARFLLDREDLRLCASPRLDRLPNRGQILYVRFGWGLDPRRLLRLARLARLRLGLRPLTGAAGDRALPWR